ncbi:MAG: hypothetical protein ACD_75C01130G0002 [uncultured bacterium]|nr:MAG: hypothetical protein ACD_75C01130G0002 [uncultured bacterium]
MRYITRIFLKGLGAALPIALTLYLVFWLGSLLENSLRPAIELALSKEGYVPGMGFIAGLVLIFLFGLLIEAWVVRRVLQMAEDLLSRIPLIKTIYGGLRDFMDYLAKTQKSKELKKVVSVSIAGTQLIGFLTGETSEFLPGEKSLQGLVSVYLPMSYQIGGFTVYVSRDVISPMDLPVEDAMRLVLTAGLSSSSTQPEK